MFVIISVEDVLTLLHTCQYPRFYAINDAMFRNVLFYSQHTISLNCITCLSGNITQITRLTKKRKSTGGGCGRGYGGWVDGCICQTDIVFGTEPMYKTMHLVVQCKNNNHINMKKMINN